MDFTVLYTHQKTKKSKKWQDGKLRVSNNGKVVLLNDSGNQLETVYVKADQIKVGEEIESDRHLITIEEETKSNSNNAQIVNQECNGSSDKADHHQRPLMRNPLRKRRMGFTVPRQLNQQQSSSDLSKENIPFNKPHIGYNSQHVDFESSAPLTTTTTTYPANISTPLHSSDIKSQVQPSCFTLVGQTNRNEHEAREVNHCQNTRVDLTWNDDQGVPNYIDQPQGTVDRIHISNSYVQSNEESKHSDNEKSHRPAGKRSASQILALLGKKKQSFQPPLKKTKFETKGNGDSLSSGNVDVREPVTECRQSSVPRERLDGAQIKELLEVKDHQGEATIDGDHPPQDTNQGMLASTEQNVTGTTPVGNLQRDKEFEELSDEKNKDCGKVPMILETLNNCLEHNAHTTLPKSLVTGRLDRNGKGQVVTHLQQSYETGVGMYGVACIHRTRIGEDCGSVEVRVGVNRGQCTGIKQNVREIVSSDNQSLDNTRLATMEISKSRLKDEKIGGDRDGRLGRWEEDEIVDSVMDAEAGRGLDREHIADNDNVCGCKQLGVAGATVMKSDRPEDEKTEGKNQDKDQTERENLTAQMYGYKSGKCEDEEGQERGSGYRHATRQHDNLGQTVSVLENNLRDGIEEIQCGNLDVPIGSTGSLKTDECSDGKEVNTWSKYMEGKQRLEVDDKPQPRKDLWEGRHYAATVTGEGDLKDINGGTCSMAVFDEENHIEAVTVSFTEVEDEVRSTFGFAQSNSDLEGNRKDTQKGVDDVITNPGGQKFSAEVMNPVSGCVYLDIEQPSMGTSKESLTPSCDIIMERFDPMQNNSSSISELQKVVNSTVHAASPMDRNKVVRELQESTENVITSTKNESSNSNKFLTDDTEIETESGRSSPGTGSCGRSQVDCTFDTSSDLTTNHSQCSLLSVTSIDTLDYSLPSSQPDCPNLSKGGSISIQESKKIADDLSCCSESQVCERDSRESEFVLKSDMTERQRCEENETLYRNNGNDAMVGLYRSNQMIEESSQEFLNDVTDIFENTLTPQTASDGPERMVNVAKNVEASVMSSDISSSSFKLFSFFVGEEANVDDAPLVINSSSPPPNDDRGFGWGFSEITEANVRPDVEMTQLHHINNHDTYEEEFVKDPFSSSSSLLASNILTHPSDLQSPAINGTDLIKSSFDSQLHNKPKRQSHYWRQPLASSLVRRRPPSPSLICASSYRDELLQEDSSQLHPGKQNLNISDDLAEALYSDKNDFGKRFDMNEQYRPGFDGCKSFGDWRRLEPNKQGNLLEEEENHMQQQSHQNERNFINEDIDQQLGFVRCDRSLNWKRQNLIESLDSLKRVNQSQQPCCHSEGKLIKDDISETQRYGYNGPESFRGWRRLEFNEPLNTLEKVNHIPQLMHRNKPNLNNNQQFMSLSSQHRVPSMEKQDASHSIDDLFSLVNGDCEPLESVFITSRDTDCHAQPFNRDKGILDTEERYENLAFKSQDEMSSHTVSTKQFIEGRVPEWNSRNISTSCNIKTGRMATPQYQTSSSTLDRKEMSPIVDHPDSCHRKSESSQKVPSLSQRSPSCVTEMSLPDVQPMHIFSQPESMVVSPQCVPCISPVIETEESSVVYNIEEFESQIEHLRWLEGDDPLLSKTSRIVNGTPMVAKVDGFTEEQNDVLVCPREEAREQTVPLVDNSTKDATTDRSSDISKPAKGSQSSLIQAVKDASSPLISYHQRPSQDNLFSQAAESSTRWKPKEGFLEDDAPSSKATIFKKHLRTPVVAMATEHYEASQLFTDYENAESRKLVQSSVKSFGKDQTQSFCIPDPYPDGQTNNSIYNSLDHSQRGRITFSGSSSSRWESSEPSQQQEYRNHPENTSSTPCLDISDFANKTSSHGKFLLQQNDRKKAVAIDRTSTSSLSAAEKRAGSFQRPLIRDLRQGKVHGLEGRDICAELFFPILKDTSTASIPQRQLQIPTKFPDVISYKRVLTAVLKEHVNIILYGVAYNYFSALSKVDISSYSPCSNNSTNAAQNPPCQHKQPSKRVCVKKEGPNKGRFFFACSKARGSQCKFFQWSDQNSQRSSKGSSSRPLKEVLSDSKSIEMYVKSFGVSLYCESQLIRKNPFSDHLAGAPAWIRKYRQSKLNSERKKLYLRISRKESSSVYGKDDLWVISKDLTFDPSNSFLAKSVFHGPNTASEVEIEPVSGYSPSNWPGEVTVHALHAYNASTELSCLHNIQEFVNPRILPVLPALLNRYPSDVNSSTILPQKSFKSPAVASQSNRKLFCSSQQIREMAENVIGQYHLNEDQATALLSVARMFIDEETDGSPVSLIHGVFGAGKSYLLAVTVLFLYQLFHLHQENGGDPNDWKVLISSTTNVAVDRILLSLLQLGFEEFIRVGSIRKIAKPVLPYSVHASDKESQELKELQEMLKGDLSTKEKSFVRKSIERHRLGLNKKMLSKVLVVGVTCAACTFPCITNLKFPVVLLDECSQITEPACLLPVARFECQKLVLVGDPKQLDPTIQGSEPAHQFSLEQTLFDRLLLLGYEPTMLRTQYRCHPRISAIANELFYRGKLIDGVDQSQRKELAEGFPTLSFYNVAGGRECRTTGGSYLNDKEAVFLVTMLEMLMVSGVEPSQVGVITLYKAQVSHISTLLQQSRLVGLRDLKAIQISTVDAFQGGEKDIIILSCVRSDFMGFAASDKRTNVALTRSKHHLLIVGNQRILSANSLWSKVILKCRECKNGIQDSSSLMKEWTAKLDEVMLEEKKAKKKTKRVLKRKEMDEIIQSEFTDSPPLSLDSEDEEEEHRIGESTSAVRSQFKPTEKSLQSEITHPPAWTQNQLSAADTVITSSQTTSDLRVIDHGIAQSLEVAAGTPKIVTNSSSTNSDEGDSVRNVAEEQVLKVRHSTDGVFHGADRLSVQSGDVITELARLENSDAGQNLRDKTEIDASLSNSPFFSENGKILVSLGTEVLLGSEATSASFEKSPSGEGTTTTIWTDDIGSPSYSPLKDVVESSDDDNNELPNFEFDTDFS